MSNNRDLLTEAIADAKAVKETAIANAKLALEEAFTPHLKSMLSAKLEEIDKDDDVKEGAHEEDEMKEGMHEKDKKVDEYGSMKKYEEDDVKKEGMHDSKKDKEVEEEINLDEILAELESELNETKDKEEVKEEEISETEDVSEAEHEEVEDEEIDLEDMSDDDLKDFIEDVIADMVKSGELEAGDNFEEEDEDAEEEVGVDIMEKKDEEKKMEEGKHEDKEKVKEEEDKKKKMEESEIAEVYKEKEALESELKEAHEVIDTLRSDLNEVNLLNAKLLYTNKIFKAKNLTESQKVKVLGAFDKANTVKESKLVYETLNEGLKSKKKSPITESLGAASRVSGNVNTKKPIIKADPMVERFKKLAGLT